VVRGGIGDHINILSASAIENNMTWSPFDTLLVTNPLMR
jgi:hypothetical protein